MEVPLPNQSYVEGLRTNDVHLLESLVSISQATIVDAIRAEGGSQADGILMFQIAVLEIANTVRASDWPEEVPLLPQIQALALAHYVDWRAERGALTEASAPEEPATSQEPSLPAISQAPFIPAPEQLRATRRQYVAWSKYVRLTPRCQETLRNELSWHYYRPAGTTGEAAHSDEFSDCLMRYRELLGPSATEGGVENGLPVWATEAVLDEKGYALWQTIEQATKAVAQQRIEVRQSKQTRRNWMIVGLLVGIVLLYWLYTWYSRPAAVVVYKDNFAPPQSLVADMQARYGQLAPDDSTTVHTSDCELLFRVADEHYQKKEYEQAAEELEDMLDNAQSPCQSDALFYLGIIGLQLDQPGYTLASFAKIEDLEHFGEDIYWYQAMAFVKLAETEPQTKDRAARALERAIGNIQDSVRREQVQRMHDKMVR